VGVPVEVAVEVEVVVDVDVGVPVGVAVAVGDGVGVNVEAFGELPGAAVIVGMPAPRFAVTAASLLWISTAFGSWSAITSRRILRLIPGMDWGFWSAL